MTMKNIASPLGFAALLSAALLGLAPAAHAQVGAFNDSYWPQQEPSLGNSTTWGVRLPEGLAAARRPDGSSYPNDSLGLVLLSRGLSQVNRFRDPQRPPAFQDALKRVNPNGTVEDDPTPYVDDRSASYGHAALGVLTSAINNSSELAGVTPSSKVYSFRFTGATPTEKEVIGTLNYAGSYVIPIVTIAVDPIVGAAGGDFSRCSGDLQSAIDRAYKKGTLLFVDSRNTLLGNCNNVMLVGPVGPKTYSRPNSKTQIVAPDQTWAADVLTGSSKPMSGMAPVITAGAAALVRGPLMHRLDPGMRLNAEVLRAALRAGTDACPDCAESARTPLNLQRTMQKVVEAAETNPVGWGSGLSMMAGKALVAPGGMNVVSGSLELERECVQVDLEDGLRFGCTTRYRGSDWYYVPDLQGKELSISLLQQSAGAFGLKVVRYFADGSYKQYKELTTKPCDVTTLPCKTSDSLRIPADANVMSAFIEVSAYAKELRPYDFMLYAVKN